MIGALVVDMGGGSGGWIRTNVPSFKGWCLRPLDYTASIRRRAGGSNARGDVIAGLGLASQPLASRAALRVWSRRCVSADSGDGSRRQKQPLRRQQPLKQPPRAAGAGVVAPESLGQFLVPRTMRSPRLTFDSDGKPLRRLLMVVKAHVVFVDRLHGTPPGWLVELVVRGEARSADHRS